MKNFFFFIIIFISYYSVLNASPINFFLQGNIDGIPLHVDNIKKENKTYFSIKKDSWNISSFNSSDLLQKIYSSDLERSNEKNSIYLKIKYKF
jgi:hypothetical protein|tara:strand:- start:459 stop:737 length:279 start_codon:yes stop_codon:yes gene_type:complete